MAVAIARYAGARHVVVTDINDYRLKLARDMGASRALNVTHESLDQTITDLGMEEGFDPGVCLIHTFQPIDSKSGTWEGYIGPTVSRIQR